MDHLLVYNIKLFIEIRENGMTVDQWTAASDWQISFAQINPRRTVISTWRILLLSNNKLQTEEAFPLQSRDTLDNALPSREKEWKIILASTWKRRKKREMKDPFKKFLYYKINSIYLPLVIHPSWGIEQCHKLTFNAPWPSAVFMWQGTMNDGSGKRMKFF